MTELDEIVTITKMSFALRDCKAEHTVSGPDREAREWFYLSRVGIDLKDFNPALAARLDRKAAENETIRRKLVSNRQFTEIPYEDLRQ